MYFKKLELVGFKSFMHKTTLHFEPGITAIVGPNGCGKSNIFDGIRWVLGEQSVRSLRGSDMQDVIFNGTDSQSPLSMAEVSLTFDNENKFFNVDHHEVVITRRIFRSGESEYCLNKATVRLKDILDLLMGTGIGAESYSLVAQGKIDLILSSRPEDRRLVFDEAAGITKYKTQKREALRKLEETEQNLLRVNDIITEVKRQIGSLERQANKARRYKETFEELKSKEVNLGLMQKDTLSKEKFMIIAGHNALLEQEEKIAEAIKVEEENLTQRNREIQAWQEQIGQIKLEIANLENAVSSHNQHISFNQERIEELKKTEAYLSEQMIQAKNRVAQNEDKLNKLKAEAASIQKNIEEKTLFLKTKEGEFNRVAEAIKNALENITRAKKDILEAVTKTSQVKNEVTDLGAQEQVHLARQKRLKLEKAKVNEEKTISEENLNNLAKELKQIESQSEDLTRSLSRFKDDLRQENLSWEQLRQDLADLEKQLLTLQSHKEFLDKLKVQYEDITTSMNAVVYLDKALPAGLSGLIVKIKQGLKPYTSENPQVESKEFRISGEAKPIDLDSQKVSAKIKDLEAKILTLKNTQATKEGRIEELNKNIEGLQQKQQEQQMVLTNKKTILETLGEQFNKINQEEEIIASELSEVNAQLADLAKVLTQRNAQLSELEQKHKNLELSMHNEQELLSGNSNSKEQILVSIAETKTELEAFSKRSHSEENTLKALEENLIQDKAACVNLEKQGKENLNKQEFLVLEIKDLQNRIVNTQKDIQDRQVSLKDSEDKYNQVSGGLTDIVKKIEEQKKHLDGLKDKLYNLQMQEKDLDFKYTSLKDRLLTVYKVDLDSQECLGLGIPEGTQENRLGAEIRQLKEKLDSYGTVNLVAIEEYDELKERYDFLVQQHNDLVSAKDSLQDAIRKINQTTRKLFVETFEKVREEFKNYFRLLFNGGDAQLFLIDEQDPLESGIEIICRPPGKKLQNVLLLSGGEKSLSAIALIFAIFKVKPAPFCVLDEIDAALDEANVDRFGRLFQEFTSTSQFIVITHNKRTIANANVMYGITMEQSGISKIVSVKFTANKDKVVKEDREPVAA